MYINNEIKIIITCHTHGDFEQKPTHHLAGHGCRKCADEERRNSSTTKKFFARFRSGDGLSHSKMGTTSGNPVIVKKN